MSSSGGVTVEVMGFEWQNAKVLVTGASGFKGAWLCAALCELGAEVYGTVRNQIHPSSAYKLLNLQDRVVAFTADISDRQQVYDLVNTINPDVIFHLAAKALVPVGLRDPRRTFDVNINGTLNLIEACRRVKVCNRMLVCSTDHVFGNVEPSDLPQHGFDERTRVSYGGPYDTSKAAMELLVRSYHFTFWQEVPSIGITRCANVFGFGDTNLRRVIPEFISSAKKTKHIPLKYRKNGRQFIYVTDAIAGYIKGVSALSDGAYHERSNLSRPENRTPFTHTFHFAIEHYAGSQFPYIEMKELAELTGRLFGATVADGLSDYAPNENRVQALSCDTTRQNLNWRTLVSLGEGIEKLGHWYDAPGNDAESRQIIRNDLQAIVRSLSGGEKLKATA